jgi:aminoglycoside 2'-N-acetyltransferase I
MHVDVRHTWQVGDDTRHAAWRMLVEAFGDNTFTELDWEHSLGGVHAFAWDGDVLVGHASIVQRRLLHRGRAIRTGYVEGVGVRASHRREGVGTAVMAAIEAVARGAYDLAALASTDLGLPLYAGRGWRPWQGRTFAMTTDGIVRTADADDSVMVMPFGLDPDLGGDLVCDWREGDLW